MDAWGWLIGLVLTYCGTVILYRLFLHPISHIPGPRLAAITRWYEAYYDVILGGQYTCKIAKLHKIYGPIIRISPFEIHVNDPDFFDNIYRSDGRWDKYSWTYDAFGAKGSTIFCIDHDIHRAYRRAIAPYFSKSNVVARQNLLFNNVDRLCQRITMLAGTVFDLGAAVSAFTRDNANEYILDKVYRELELEDFGVQYSIVSSGAGGLWRTTKHFPWYGPMMKRVPIAWISRVAGEGYSGFLLRIQRSQQDTRGAMEAAKSSSNRDKSSQTMVEAIMRSDLPPEDKSLSRIFAEVATVTGAASETTAGAMRLILYHVFTNEPVRQTLRRELSTVDVDSAGTFPLQKLEQLPYLTAILKEGMRLSPATASRATRVTDKDLHYSKWTIPAGTPVGMTTLLLHTDEKSFPDPLHFNPDRWMGSTHHDAKYAPFSRGTRACLGMHLAWSQMYLLLATLVQRFDFTVQGATASDFEMERDDFGIGTKAGCHLMVHVDQERL